MRKMASHACVRVECLSTSSKTHPNNGNGCDHILHSVSETVLSKSHNSPTTDRRSANYKRSTWNADFLESFRMDHVHAAETEYKLEKLKKQVKDMVIDDKLEPSTLLKLIEDIQRLGLAHYFDKDIKSVLNRLACNKDTLKLSDTALIFRLLRQNGIWFSQDEFERFKDVDGNFMSSFREDVTGMLNFYEASYLALEAEHLMDEAKLFTKKHLGDLSSTEDKSIADYVNHTLEIPLQYRIPRLETRYAIDTYPARRNSTTHGNDLLELAKLDFNLLQAMNQKELQELSRWWRDTGLADNLSFARDRLTECFFISVAVAHKPHFSACRKALTKVYKLITIIDDIYDVHGYLDELQLFTNAVERWSINAMDDLPDYMKLTFLTLYNTVNELGHEILKDKGHNCILFLRKSWEAMCKAFLVEAQWYYGGQTPTFDDYLNNGWVSGGVGLALFHAYFYVSPKITPEALYCLYNYHDVLRLPSTIFRLANDLATSKAELERGETTNAILCYAKQIDVSPDDARKHMSKLIDENWKCLNAIQVAHETPFTSEFIDLAFNHARIAHCLYQHGDSYGSPDLMKKRVSSLIIEPV